MLYSSLRQHCPDSKLFVLCLDSWCKAILSSLALEGLYPIDLNDLERDDPELLHVKPTRTLIEYYFTLTPCFLRYLLMGPHSLNHVTYLDADLYFFSDPTPLIAGLAAHQIGIVPHRYSPGLNGLERFGLFNVAFNYFNRGELSLSCLDRWRCQCLAWCHDQLDGERFADQKYLNEWPQLYGDQIVIHHPGVDLAPWNLGTHHLVKQGELLMVDNQPLICFHYHGISRLFGAWYDSNLRKYGKKPSKIIKSCIYLPYVHRLDDLRCRYGNIIKGKSIRYNMPIIKSGQSCNILTRYLLDKPAAMTLTFLSGTLIYAGTRFLPKNYP